MLKLEGYEILETVYEGTKSVIYRGRKQEQKVILKLPNTPYPSSTDIQRFKKEAEILKQVDSPYIVKIYNTETYNGLPVLIEEDIEGKSLNLKVKSPISLEIFLDIAINSVKALNEIHNKNIIHKDIKPHNIIYQEETKQLQIIDFGSATQLSRENPSLVNMGAIEGTLSYISPEQTGRMNRTLDYRSDYYSLGVTFYQLLTGKLPFNVTDTMELIHAHIAKMPTPPSGLGSGLQPTVLPNFQPAIYKAISDIVMKLLQKNPEDRYQSVTGILYDLEWCLSRIRSTNEPVEILHTTSLLVGTNDFSPKFQIPEKLYGREHEIHLITETFTKTVEILHTTSLLLISGRSGIGKSALIKEVNKSTIAHKGYFVSGKYDPFKKSIPYYGITLALQSLIQQILAGKTEELDIWKDEFLLALGSNGKVITDVIPELEGLIGVQEPVIELGTVESENRFRLVFQNFIQVFCKKEHPIAIFLDDMQWADTPSINLIQNILLNPEMKYLCIILSFRDNEVLPTDSFSLMLEELNKNGFKYQSIYLNPLTVSDINDLVQDTLHSEESRIIEIADILAKKTSGNPFFVNEVFRSFYNKNFIEFRENKWNWDIEKIRSVEISENVVDLLIEKIKELSIEQIEIMKLAACIGDTFLIELFSQISFKSMEELSKELINISNTGFFIISENLVRFVHDKVREATYSLLSEEEKSKYHYKIGNTILKNTKPEDLEDFIFTIVNQLNQGIIYVNSLEEKIELVKLNLKAGRKAKASTAYDSALKFLKEGILLLTEDKWEKYYEITIEMHKELAECEYLLGHFEEADTLYESALENAKSVLDKIPLIHIQLRQKVTEQKGDEAFQIGFAILEQLGVKVPDISKPETIQEMFLEHLAEYKRLLGDRPISSLLNLPRMSDLRMLEAISLITNLGDIAILLKSEMLGLMSIMGVTLSLQYGNAQVSPISYVMWGVITNLGFRDYNSGYELGQLALQLNQKKFPSDLIFGKVNAFYGWNINHYKHHTKYDLEIARKGFEITMANSDLVYAMYFIMMFLKVGFNIGQNLDEVLEYAKKCQVFAGKYKQLVTVVFSNPTKLIVYALQGRTDSPTSLNCSEFSEEEYIKNFSTFGSATVYFYLRKFQLCYLFGEYDKCLEVLPDVEKYFPHMPAHIAYTEFFFYKALLFYALPVTSNDEEKKRREEKLIEAHSLLKLWSQHCEDNFLHLFLLAEAEKARVEGRDQEAMQFYEKSVESAIKFDYTQNAAIANELAGRFYLSKGFEKVAITYLREANHLYSVWGAMAKVKQLEEKYPQLKRQAVYNTNPEPISSLNTQAWTTSSRTLDIFTIMKASQAISEEIQLDKLLEKMMQILIENAGAERGFFLLKEKENWYIQAEDNANQDKVEVLKSKPLEDTDDLSKGIVNYVIRTKNLVLLDDAAKNGIFVNDNYVKLKKPKSILCYPILYRSKMIGVVYLENNLSSNLFTPNRVEILQFLSSQIAISIENSLLYMEMEQKVVERTAQVNEMLVELRNLYTDSENKRKEIEILAESRKKLSLVGQMAAGIVHDIKNPMASIKYLAETLGRVNISEESRSENLSLILREMDRLSDLTFEILDFSKGQLNLDLQSISLKNFVEDIHKFLALDFEYMGVQCILDLRYTDSIRIDKDRMRRVIVNIAKNAIEAMYDGKKEYTFTIRTQKVEDNVIISLMDNGPGIPESVKSNMFQAFATEGKAKGTGLGLFMSKWIVDSHGGDLKFESEAGLGTTFFIRLPLA